MNNRKPQLIFKTQDHAGVRQDKRPPGRSMEKLGQPLTANTSAEDRPKHHGSETRRTSTISGRAPFDLKARVAGMAQSQGLTVSEVVVALVRKALQAESDLQYGALLEPIIRTQIHKDIQAHTNRLAALSLQAHRSAEHSLMLLIKALSILLEIDQKELSRLIEETRLEAKENVLHQLAED